MVAKGLNTDVACYFLFYGYIVVRNLKFLTFTILAKLQKKVKKLMSVLKLVFM